jgi:tetratricopeptide (TPR) repeat protein
MSMMSQWATLKERAAGRWQLPLLVVSLILLTGSLLRSRPAPTSLPLGDAINFLDRQIASGFFGDAIELSDTLLARQEYSDAQRAQVHLRAARARFSEARRLRMGGGGLGFKIATHYQQALKYSAVLAAEDYEQLGRTFEWQGDYTRALQQYEEAIARNIANPLDLRRRMLAMMIDRLDVLPRPLGEQLDHFLADAFDSRLDLALWAIERKLLLFDQLETLGPASTLIARHRDRFQASDLRDRYAFLEAWLLSRTGHYDEAERYLRAIRSRVETVDYTYARTGWLLGRVVMRDEGPQRPSEARSFFSNVHKFHPGTPFSVAARIGSAEALVMLQRDREALETYRAAADEFLSLGEVPESSLFPDIISRDVLRVSLSVMSDTQRRAGRMAEAVEYAKLAASLTDMEDVQQATMMLEQLGNAQSLWATELAGSPDRSNLSGALAEVSSSVAQAAFVDAAETFLRLAQVGVLNERLAASSSWRAGELLVRGGERVRAANVFVTFARERPQNPLVPRAFLRVGQLLQSTGQLAGAVEAYRECYRRFPRSLDGARALVPMARCYLAMGPDSEEMAEKTLRIVLYESEIFTPQAPEFADALYLLGDAQNRRGDFEQAIATLEEVLERYPHDPRATRARFLLADSSFKSGLALKSELPDARSAAEVEQIRVESTARFMAARAGYRKLIDEYAARDPTSLNQLERVYFRHASLYEADCFFETQDYRKSLKLYDEAVGMFKDTPNALAAYVQIINSHVFLDQLGEARAALARALVLVDSIPDEAFQRSISPEGRSDWKRYFDWLDQAELF